MGTAEGGEISWEKYEKLTGTGSGFDEEEDGREEVGEVGARGESEKSGSREKRKNDISMTLNGSRDRENRVGSPTIREKDESKFAGELEGVRLKEETDKHHLSTVSSVDGEK